MSFILDALKKSESDRQRQSGPALFEVKVAPPRAQLPLWAIAIVALLVVNLGIVIWLVLRHPDRSAASLSAAPPAASAATLPVAPPPVVPASASANSPAPAFAPSTPAGVPPPASQPLPAAAVALPSTAPASGTTAPSAAPPSAAATSAGTTAAAVAGGAAGAAAAGSANPEDYAPAEEPASPGIGGHVRRGTAAGVPLYQDAATTAQIPQLRLDLHVYSAAPQDRFVMINMHKLREGDTLPEGVHVDSITPDGAVLSYNGSKFLLPRD